MKKINILILTIFLNTNLFSQNLIIELVKGETAKVDTIFLKQNNEVLDTLAICYFEIKILDRYIQDENTVAVIYESKYSIFYDKFNRVDSTNEWEASKTSGMWGNPNQPNSAIPKDYKGHQEYSFKIVGEDKVNIKIGENESIKDCNDFEIIHEAKEREYQEWLIQEEKKKEEERKKKKLKLDKKEFEKIK